MNCSECGAALPGAETCHDRFLALLAAEHHNLELGRMHGLTVLTYHLQHPSRTKPWYQAAGYDMLRRSFGQGRDWWDVLSQGRRQGTAERDVARWKNSYGATMPPETALSPVAGEMTIADIDPAAPTGQAGTVLAWGRSVAEGRVRVGDTAALSDEEQSASLPHRRAGRAAMRRGEQGAGGTR